MSVWSRGGGGQVSALSGEGPDLAWEGGRGADRCLSGVGGGADRCVSGVGGGERTGVCLEWGGPGPGVGRGESSDLEWEGPGP